jgi:hypothetical protein
LRESSRVGTRSRTCVGCWRRWSVRTVGRWRSPVDVFTPIAGQAELDAARLILARIGISAADLLHGTSHRQPAPAAYLTLRPAHRAPDGGQLYEIGVIGHGPGGDQLAGRVIDQIRTWDADYRSRSVAFEIQPGIAGELEPAPGRFSFDTPLHRLIVSWG